MANNHMNEMSRVAVITGACGGMGRVCARVLGRRYQLALVDVDAERLARDAESLRNDGYRVALTQTVDISEAAQVQALANAVAKTAPLGALVHTAGLSPVLAPWQSILKVNLLGTVLLLDAFLPLADAGSVAVCIASVAGHRGPPEAGLDAALDRATEPDMLARLEPFLRAAEIPNNPYELRMPAYSISKYAVIRLCEQRAAQWAARGGRIVSVSPGLIATPMGNREFSENALAAGMLEATPHKRMGTPLDIANAVEFLCSELAGYINGCDLRVDYGTVAALHCNQ